MKSKMIKSGDGKMGMKSEEVTHVCMAPNHHPLLQCIMY